MQRRRSGLGRSWRRSLRQSGLALADAVRRAGGVQRAGQRRDRCRRIAAAPRPGGSGGRRRARGGERRVAPCARRPRHANRRASPGADASGLGAVARTPRARRPGRGWRGTGRAAPRRGSGAPSSATMRAASASSGIAQPVPLGRPPMGSRAQSPRWPPLRIANGPRPPVPSSSARHAVHDGRRRDPPRAIARSASRTAARPSATQRTDAVGLVGDPAVRPSVHRPRRT